MAIKQLGVNPSGNTDAVTKGLLDTKVAKGELLVNAQDYGATGAGLVNESSFLQAAINATPSGGTLRIGPGRYLVQSTLIVSNKSITIEAQGAVLVQDADVDVLRITGTFETIYDVTDFTVTAITVDASLNIPALTLTTSSATGWVRGDLVKLISDDPIPDARPTDTTSKCRLGQFFYVRDVTDTSVTLIGALHDPMSTNLRISRLPKTTTRVSGLRIETTNFVDWTGGGLKLFNLYAPQVDIRYGQMPATLTSLRSCYRPNLTVVADGGNSDPGNGKLAYAVLDTGSEGGQFNISAGSIRHAYTDGSNLVEPGSTSVRDYGRPYGHIVTGVAMGTLSSAWDTHSTGMNITFANCVAIHCANGFSLRGRYNNIFNGVAYSCRSAFLLQDEPRLGQDAKSFGHTIDGLVLHDTPGIYFRSNWEDATAPGYNTRVTVPTTMRNVTLDNLSALNAIQILNQTVRLENIRIVAGPTVTDSHVAITVANGDVTFRDIELDYLNNTAGTSMKAIETTVDSVVKGSGLKWLFQSEAAARISKVLTGTSSTSWNVRETDISYNIIPGTLGLAGSRFDYTAQSTGHNMAWLGSSNASIEATSLPMSASISRNPIVYIRATPTDSNRTLTKLQPGAFRGQRLNIANSSTTGGYTVTVKHGTSSWLTANTGAADVVIPNTQSAWWIWDGTLWRQEEDVLVRAALDLKAPLASPAFTGTPTGITKAHVGLGNVDNTSNATERAATATLANKTLTAPVISTITNTGTITLPTSTDTLVGRDTTDTLTNKTLTAPVLSGTLTGTYTIGGTPTFPSSVVSLTGTQTLTNKTMSGSSNTFSNISADSTIDGTTNKVYTGTEKTKLAGVEAAADVTDTANVTSAGAEMISRKNQANGYAGLDSSALIPSVLLPSYVDDVLEAANFAALPGTGTTGKIYVTLDTNKIYRWSGSAYVEISPSPGSTDSVTEGSVNLYYTNTRADARIAAAVGVSVQAYDSDLTAFAAKTAPSGVVVGTTDTQTLTNKTLTDARVNAVKDTNGATLLGASATASAVNFITVQNAASGGSPAVVADGSGTNLNLNLVSKGTGVVQANGVELVTLSGTQTLTNKTLAGLVGSSPIWFEIHSTYGTRAVGYGENTLGFMVPEAFTLTGVVYRGETADVVGPSVFELRQNGTQITGTSKSITAANQWGYDSDIIVSGLSVSLAAGDIIRPYISSAGSVPGKGFSAVLIGTKSIAIS